MFTRILNLNRLLLLIACTWSPLGAAQHWISVSTPHFEMYTTNSEKQAIRALQTFEQVRYFFLQNSFNKQVSEARVRIIAFSSEKDYKPYRLNEGAFAYYLQSRERDYIVMQDIEPDHHQVAVHEYTHLIVQHMNIHLPIWLNEGMADVYSSLEPRGQQAMVGRPLPQRIYPLQQQHWMDWNALFAVDQNSPFYNEREKMSIFYAQSWLTVHMLALNPSYAANFSRLVNAIAGGMATPAAFKSVYGKTTAEVGKDVESYFRQTSVKAALYNITLKKSDLETQTEDLPEFETGLALADLLASRKDTQGEAHDRLTALAARYPQNPQVEESLGYLAWQQNQTDQARKYFTAAVEHGSKSARMIYSCAELQHGAGAPAGDVIVLLKKAIAIEPGNGDARISLGQLEAQSGEYEAALVAIAPIRSVKPEQAYRLFSLAAYSQAKLHKSDEAKASAARALQYAKTPAERMQVEELVGALK